MRRWLTLLLVATGPACGAGRDAIPEGLWGGQGIALNVSSADATVEWDCAHGSIDAPLETRDGELVRSGRYVEEHGGPVREGETLVSHPARYRVRRDADTLRLSVFLQDLDRELGPFSATLGAPPRVRKCV